MKLAAMLARGRRFPLLFASALFCGIATLSQAQNTAHVQYFVADAGMTPQAGLQVKMTKMTSGSINGPYVLTGDSRWQTTDGAGSVIFSNTAVGFAYQVEFDGYLTRTYWTNSFSLTDATNGIINGNTRIYYSFIAQGPVSLANLQAILSGITNSVTPATATNIANGVYSNNPAGYIPAITVTNINTANLVITTNLIAAQGAANTNDTIARVLAQGTANTNDAAARVTAALVIVTNRDTQVLITATNSFDPTNSAANMATTVLTIVTNKDNVVLGIATNMVAAQGAANTNDTIARVLAQGTANTNDAAARVTAALVIVTNRDTQVLITATNSFDPTNSAANMATTVLGTVTNINSATLTIVTNLSGGASFIANTGGRGTNTVLTNAISISVTNLQLLNDLNMTGKSITNAGGLSLNAGKNIHLANGWIIGGDAGSTNHTGVYIGPTFPNYLIFNEIGSVDIGTSNDIAATIVSAINYATDVGGAQNIIGVGGDFASAYGGQGNGTIGKYSSVSGFGSTNIYQSSWIWSDYPHSYTSTGTNQVIFGASGGFGINTNAPPIGGLGISGPLNLNGQSIPALNNLTNWANLPTNLLTGGLSTNGLATTNAVVLQNAGATNINLLQTTSLGGNTNWLAQGRTFINVIASINTQLNGPGYEKISANGWTNAYQARQNNYPGVGMSSNGINFFLNDNGTTLFSSTDISGPWTAVSGAGSVISWIGATNQPGGIHPIGYYDFGTNAWWQITNYITGPITASAAGMTNYVNAQIATTPTNTSGWQYTGFGGQIMTPLKEHFPAVAVIGWQDNFGNLLYFSTNGTVAFVSSAGGGFVRNSDSSFDITTTNNAGFHIDKTGTIASINTSNLLTSVTSNNITGHLNSSQIDGVFPITQMPTNALIGKFLTNMQPAVTISSRGRINGLSSFSNNGCMFGPDTPGTLTYGWQEALNAATFNPTNDASLLITNETSGGQTFHITSRAGGGRIMAEEGWYWITNTVPIVLSNDFPFAITIEGAGKFNTVLATLTNLVILRGQNNAIGSRVSENYNVTFRDIGFYNAVSRTNQYYCVQFGQEINSITMDNCLLAGGGTFTNVGGQGASFTLTSTYGDDVRQGGTLLSVYTQGDNGVVIHGSFIVGGAVGLHISADHIRITDDNQFGGNGSVGGTTGGYGTVTNVNMALTGKATNGAAIWVDTYGGQTQAGGDTLIEGNHFFHCGSCFINDAIQTYGVPVFANNLVEDCQWGVLTAGMLTTLRENNWLGGAAANNKVNFKSTGAPDTIFSINEQPWAIGGSAYNFYYGTNEIFSVPTVAFARKINFFNVGANTLQLTNGLSIPGMWLITTNTSGALVFSNSQTGNLALSITAGWSIRSDRSPGYFAVSNNTDGGANFILGNSNAPSTWTGYSPPIDSLLNGDPINITGGGGASSSTTAAGDAKNGGDVNLRAGNGGDLAGGAGFPGGSGGNVYIDAGVGGGMDVFGSDGSIFIGTRTGSSVTIDPDVTATGNITFGGGATVDINGNAQFASIIADGSGLTNSTTTYFTNLVNGATNQNRLTRTEQWKVPVVVSSPATTLGHAEIDMQIQRADGVWVTVADCSDEFAGTGIIHTNRAVLVGDVPSGASMRVTNNASGTGYVAGLDPSKTNTFTVFP